MKCEKCGSEMKAVTARTPVKAWACELCEVRAQLAQADKARDEYSEWWLTEQKIRHELQKERDHLRTQLAASQAEVGKLFKLLKGEVAHKIRFGLKPSFEAEEALAQAPEQADGGGN